MAKPKSVAFAITANHLARNPGRRWTFTLPSVLLGLAMAGWLVTTVLLVLLLVSGSHLVNNDGNSPGPMRLFLSRFAIMKASLDNGRELYPQTNGIVLQFNGIVPDPNDASSYLITFYLFPTTIGWEYPSAISKAQSAGFMGQTHPVTGLSLAAGFVQVGQRVGLDSSAWGCFTSPGAQICKNPFYAALWHQRPWDPAPSYLYLFLCMTSLLLALRVFIVELLIAYRPSALRCRCWFAKRICPCPRGEAHEIALLPQSFWDRYRLWIWLMMPFVVALSVVMTYYYGESLIVFFRLAAQNNNSGSIMKAAAPQMGSGFMALSWALIVAPFISTLLLLARLWMSHSTPDWAQQEVMGASKEEAVIGLEKDARYRASEED